jgi:hypothetical protein
MTLSRHASSRGRSRLGYSLGDLQIFLVQRFLAFDYLGMRDDALDGAHFDALRLLKMANAFGAKFWIDLVELYALIDRAVRTFRLAHIAVDTLIGD